MLWIPSRGIWTPPAPSLPSAESPHWRLPGRGGARQHALGSCVFFPGLGQIRRETGSSGGGTPPSTLLTSLVAHWRLDEASGTRVEVASGVNLTENGTVGNAAGKIGSAAAFTADAANFLRNSAPTALNLTANGQFEIAAWVYFTSTSPSYCFFDLKGTGSNYIQVAKTGTVGAGNAWRVFIRSIQIDWTGAAPSINTWYLLSIWDDGVNANLAVNNGTPQTSARSGAAIPANSDLRVGQNTSGTGAVSGRVDSCSLWVGRVLTSGERTSLYGSGAGLDYPF